MLQKNQKAVIFDRDGTLIVDKVYLNDPEQIEYLPGVFAALQLLKSEGFVFFVATNQSGVPRGHVTIQNLDEIHRRIRDAFKEQNIEILHFYYAPYLTDSDHFSRKPNPGMLLQAASDFSLDLGLSWMVGDRMIDVEAGHRAGANSVLLKSDKYENENTNWAQPEIKAVNLLEAAKEIVVWERARQSETKITEVKR